MASEGFSATADVGKSPTPRSTMTRAITQGLALDDAAREAGHRDGAAHAPKRPPEGGDVLAYYLGYAAGELYGRDHPTPWLRCPNPACEIRSACDDPKNCAAGKS